LKVEREIEEFWFNFRSVFTNNPDVVVVREFLNKLEELINKARELEAFVSVKPRREKRVEKEVLA
jgi:hypothetical protein